jgi:hypothetical protein
MYKINSEKIFYDTIDQNTVAIDSDTGIYYGINGLSSEVFNFLVKGAKQDDILSALREMPDVPADMEERLKVFVEQMLDLQILLAADSSTLEIRFNSELAAQDNFYLSIIEYSDAQETLLADPIEDVDFVQYNDWKPEIQ